MIFFLWWKHLPEMLVGNSALNFSISCHLSCLLHSTPCLTRTDKMILRMVHGIFLPPQDTQLSVDRTLLFHHCILNSNSYSTCQEHNRRWQLALLNKTPVKASVMTAYIPRGKSDDTGDTRITVPNSGLCPSCCESQSVSQQRGVLTLPFK